MFFIVGICNLHFKAQIICFINPRTSANDDLLSWRCWCFWVFVEAAFRCCLFALLVCSRLRQQWEKSVCVGHGDTKEKRERRQKNEKKRTGRNEMFFCIFSLIIQLQLGVCSYQFCNIKQNVNRHAEFTFIRFTES